MIRRIKRVLLKLSLLYIFSWILLAFLIVLMVGDDTKTLQASFRFFLDIAVKKGFLIFAHFFFAFLLIIAAYVQYFIKVYKKKGGKQFLKMFGLKLVLPIVVILAVYHLIAFANSYESFDYHWNTTVENTTGVSNDHFSVDGKHRGMSVKGWKKSNQKALSNLLRNNVEWVAITPLFNQASSTAPEMNTPLQIGEWTRQDSIYIQSIQEMHTKGIRVQLKPHLWTGEGWRANIKLATAEEWNIWFEGYRKNMLHYAQMAQLTKVELFCVGTELKSTLTKVPEKWIGLIQEVKSIYSGELTYAANWDGEYDMVPFWEQMDYIGIQAYFPLTKNANPNIKDIKQGWKRHLEKLERLTLTHNRPILFTEVGYKSEASATIKPWKWDNTFSILYRKKSDKTQQLAYEALFQLLWQKDWFAGAYIWQWETRNVRQNASRNLDFTPQYKPAENTIATWYGRLSVSETP